MSSVPFEMNSGYGGDPIEVTVTCERDGDVFVSLIVEDADGDEIADLILTEPDMIDAFFAMVDKAKVNWQALR